MSYDGGCGDMGCSICQFDAGVTRLSLSSYAFNEYGHDAKLYNGIHDLEQQNAALCAALKGVIDAACSLMCPSTWKTADGPPPHSPQCLAAHAALAQPAPAENSGDVKE